MMRVVALAVACAAFAAPASAQICRDREQMIASLSESYGEKPAGMGIGGDGDRLFVLLIEPLSGTWTIISAMPDGQACFVAAGADWTTAPKEKDDGT